MDPAHDDTRSTLHAMACSPSVRAWQDLCDAEGVTLTAVLDAVGHAIARGDLTIPAAVLADARAITATRRRRRS